LDGTGTIAIFISFWLSDRDTSVKEVMDHVNLYIVSLQ